MVSEASLETDLVDITGAVLYFGGLFLTYLTFSADGSMFSADECTFSKIGSNSGLVERGPSWSLAARLLTSTDLLCLEVEESWDSVVFPTFFTGLVDNMLFKSINDYSVF